MKPVIAIAAAMAVAVSVTGTAQAADSRPQLRAMLAQSRTDLRDTSAAIPAVTKEDARVVRSQLTILRAKASTLSDQLSAATDPASIAAAGRAIRAFSSQSRGILLATRADGVSLAGIATTRAQSRAALDAWTAGKLSDAAYDATQANWSLAGAHATADHMAALSGIRRLTAPPQASAAAAIALARSGRSPASVAGLTPVPGGCALPTVDSTRYLGTSTQPGLHLWTSDAQVSAQRARLVQQPALAAAHKQTISLADRLMYQEVNPTSAGDVTTRALRIGYAWLTTQQSAYAHVLASDVAAITRGHVPAPDLVDEAKIAMAAATDADWLAPDTALAGQLRQAREVLAVRSLGEMSCAIALGSDLMGDTLNKSVIIAASAATVSWAVARDHPQAAAAIAAAALTAGRRGFDVLAADGGTPEGPTYWNFQTVPVAGLLSTMDSVFGERTPVSFPDFRDTAVFAFDAPAANGSVTHYSDTDTGELRCTLPAWIAGRWGGAEATAVALAGRLRQGVELLWWPAVATPTPSVSSHVFATTGLSVLQNGPATAWLKGQAALNTHTHLDAGTVGLTVDGVDWTVDTGYGAKGDYPGYSDNQPGGKRWTYPQTQPQWHSTIRGPGLGQVVGALGRVSGSAGSARVDLASAVSGVTSASRTITLGPASLAVRDVVSSKSGVTWGWLTDAQVRLTGNDVTLAKAGRTLSITWSGLPRGATVSVRDVPASLRYLTGARASLVSVQLPAGAVDYTATATWR